MATHRSDAPWARSYTAFVKLAAAVLIVRLAFAVLLGSPIPGTHVIVTLPELPLPHWAQGIRVGGRVTAEGVVFALYDGLKLATLLVCVGAANALANPARLLKSLPGALYEAGVAVVVALTFAPHLIADAQRLRAARRLRGRPDRGCAGCCTSDCRSSKARWSVRSRWPPRWTRADTGGRPRFRPRSAARPVPSPWAGCSACARAPTGC